MVCSWTFVSYVMITILIIILIPNCVDLVYNDASIIRLDYDKVEVRKGILDLVIGFDNDRKRIKIQIVLRHFISMTAVFNEIDIGMTEVMFDGTSVYMSRRAHYSNYSSGS